MRTLTTIGQLQRHVGQSVWIGCWLNGKRSSGKIQFLQLRDGTGYMQGVVVKSEVAEAAMGRRQAADSGKLAVCEGHRQGGAAQPIRL